MFEKRVPSLLTAGLSWTVTASALGPEPTSEMPIDTPPIGRYVEAQHEGAHDALDATIYLEDQDAGLQDSLTEHGIDRIVLSGRPPGG